MSHIPASKMPHAKPHEHDEGHGGGHDGHEPLTGGPEVRPAPPKGRTPGDHAADHGALPYVAIAAVGALAIGGIVAALALRRPAPPPHKDGKGKPKDRHGKRGEAQ